MSRSHKKKPFDGVTTSSSEKKDKQDANRRDRRINDAILKSSDEDTELLDRNHTGNKSSFSKDGKVRIDPKDEPKRMRK